MKCIGEFLYQQVITVQFGLIVCDRLGDWFGGMWSLFLSFPAPGFLSWLLLRGLLGRAC